MDIVYKCLSLTPLPTLAPAFSSFRFIWSAVEQAQISKSQIEALAQSVADLLQTLEGEYHVGRLLEARASTALTNLCMCVRFSMLQT